MTNPILGLMFWRKKPVIFTWKTPRISGIHSFFCRKFLARWYLKGVLIEERVIEPWNLDVIPIGEFDELHKVPL